MARDFTWLSDASKQYDAVISEPWALQGLQGSVEPVQILQDGSIIFLSEGKLQNWESGRHQWSYSPNSLDYASIIDIDKSASHNDDIYILTRQGSFSETSSLNVMRLSMDGDELSISEPFNGGERFSRGSLATNQDIVFVTGTNYSHNSGSSIASIYAFDYQGLPLFERKIENVEIREIESRSDGIIIVGNRLVEYSNNAYIPYISFLTNQGNVAWELDIVLPSWKDWNPASNYNDSGLINAVTVDNSGDIYVAGLREVESNNDEENTNIFVAKVSGDGELGWTLDYDEISYWVNSINKLGQGLVISGGVDSAPGENYQEDDFFIGYTPIDEPQLSIFRSSEPGFERLYSQDVLDNHLVFTGVGNDSEDF